MFRCPGCFVIDSTTNISKKSFRNSSNYSVSSVLPSLRELFHGFSRISLRWIIHKLFQKYSKQVLHRTFEEILPRVPPKRLFRFSRIYLEIFWRYPEYFFQELLYALLTVFIQIFFREFFQEFLQMFIFKNYFHYLNQSSFKDVLGKFSEHFSGNV